MYVRVAAEYNDYIENSTTEHIFCDCEKIASHFCEDKHCSSNDRTEYLCLDCVTAHKKVRMTINHKMNKNTS